MKVKPVRDTFLINDSDDMKDLKGVEFGQDISHKAH
jgi:hypothetical protein